MKISNKNLINFLLHYDVVKFFGNQTLSVYADKDENFYIIATIQEVTCVSNLNLIEVIKFSDLLRFANLPILDLYRIWKYDFQHLVQEGVTLV